MGSVTPNANLRFLSEYAQLLGQYQDVLNEDDLMAVEAYANNEMTAQEQAAFLERKAQNPTLAGYMESYLLLHVKNTVQRVLKEDRQ